MKLGLNITAIHFLNIYKTYKGNSYTVSTKPKGFGRTRVLPLAYSSPASVKHIKCNLYFLNNSLF